MEHTASAHIAEQQIANEERLGRIIAELEAARADANQRIAELERTAAGYVQQMAALLQRAEAAEAKLAAAEQEVQPAIHITRVTRPGPLIDPADFGAVTDMVAEIRSLREQLAQRQQAEQRMGDWLERELNSDEEAQP